MPNFEGRIPAFREGFDSWMVGDFENKYVTWKNGVAKILPWDFIKSREWVHGQDVAYLVTQYFNKLESAKHDG